jgi:cytoskeletal protein RodZ
VSTLGLSIKALSALTCLTRLYLDLIDMDEFAGMLEDLYLPNLTHLYMLLVYSSDI